MHGVGLGNPFLSILRALFQSIRKTNDAPRLSRNASRLAALVELEAAADQIERAIVAEAGRAFALKPAPVDGEVAKQSDEELGARQMDVGIGDSYGIRVHGDHDDMRIGFADVVLDRKPRA